MRQVGVSLFILFTINGYGFSWSLDGFLMIDLYIPTLKQFYYDGGKIVHEDVLSKYQLL